MDTEQQQLSEQIVQEQFVKSSYQTPYNSGNDQQEEGKQLIQVLTAHEPILQLIRQELRGEQLYESDKGERFWIQVDRPMFLTLDQFNKPLKRVNPKTGKEEYVPNDDAINEIISTLKAAGLNPITPLTSLKEETILADLLEIESKLIVLLAIKRQEWGIDKAQYPLLIGKLKTLIQDARYRAKDGIVLKALRTVTSRLEQTNDNKKNQSIGERMTSPFKS